MPECINMPEAKKMATQLPGVMKAVEKLLEPYLFSDRLKQVFAEFSNVTVSLADAEVKFFEQYQILQPIEEVVYAIEAPEALKRNMRTN